MSIPAQHRDLSLLQPAFLTRFEAWFAAAQAAFPQFVLGVHETLRSAERQQYLWEQGRSRPGPIVTWTRHSKHQDGEAADWHLQQDGVALWDAELYEQVYRVVPPEDYGLRTLPGDLVHLQLDESIAWGATPVPAERLLILESPDRSELARFVIPPGTELLQRTSEDGARIYMRFDARTN